jgi:nuclear pore complex protein Nup107
MSYKTNCYLLLCLQSNILQVKVSISSRDNYCIDIVLRCLAIFGDGLGPHDINDGGILSTILAAGFKGNNIINLHIALLASQVSP